MSSSPHKIMSRMSVSRSSAISLCGAVALLLSGCAESEFVANSVKSLRSPQGEAGMYKVGQPYQIDGTSYVPTVDYQYAETGIASWYGPNFHGQTTANGERFDMNSISAAHRTLPLPSMVRVTNLENGRALNVRVNDRGPFSRGRIIDLSRRAAQLLGFERNGTAQVRVEIMARESIALAHGMDAIQVASAAEPPKPQAAPRMAVTSQALAPPPGTRATPAPTYRHHVAPVPQPVKPVSRAVAPLQKVDGQVQRVPVAGNTQMFVQAGAFSQFVNAHRMEALLKGVAPVHLSQVDGGAGKVIRVRLGPARSVAEADALLAQVFARGVSEAHIVVD